MHLQSVVIAALAAVVAASGRPCSRRGTYDCSGAEGKSGVMVCNNSSEWEVSPRRPHPPPFFFRPI